MAEKTFRASLKKDLDTNAESLEEMVSETFNHETTPNKITNKNLFTIRVNESIMIIMSLNKRLKNVSIVNMV